jgi:hypothetical protein
MFLRDRYIIIFSIVVGLIGAGVAGLWGVVLEMGLGGLAQFYLALIFGFLSCFSISVWYCRFMQGKRWRWGILFGPLFGGFAGAIAGALTGMAEVLDAVGRRGFEMGNLGFAAVCGATIGAFSGLIFGLLLAIVLGPILASTVAETDYLG